MKLLTYTVFLSLFVLIPRLCSAGLIDDQAQKRRSVDALFNASRYVDARASYLEHAQNGDKFAQYRVALIDYFGLGGERDFISAAAWAGVAKEVGIRPLNQLFQLIWQELDAKQQVLVKARLAEWDQKYGVTIMGKRKRVYPKAKSCTGSRVGASCDRVISNGLIWHDNGNYFRNDIVAYKWTQEDLNQFTERYNDKIYADFSSFDH